MSSQFNYSAKGTRVTVEVDAMRDDQGGSPSTTFRIIRAGDSYNRSFIFGDLPAAKELAEKLKLAIAKFEGYQQLTLTEGDAASRRRELFTA